MLPSHRLPVHGRAYVSAVIVLGFAVVSHSVYELTVHPIGYQWFLLMALTLVSGSATVKLPSVPASISISETFVFTAVLLYGPAAGTLTVALDGLVISYWMAKRRRESYRAWFNMSAPAVSVWTSAHLFFSLAGIGPIVASPGPLQGTLNQILPSLFLFALTYLRIEQLANSFSHLNRNTALATSRMVEQLCMALTQLLLWRISRRSSGVLNTRSRHSLPGSDPATALGPLLHFQDINGPSGGRK